MQNETRHSLELRSERSDPSNWLSRVSVVSLHRCSIGYWARLAPSSRLASKPEIGVSSAQNVPITALATDCRGAVMAEGVIVLPVFVMILAAVIYFHRAYAAKIDVNTQARSCAWSYAVNGCKASALPKGCQIKELPSGAETIAQLLQPQLASKVGGNSSQDIVRESDNLGKVLEKGDAISRALLGLGEGIVARPSKTIAKPSILGGGTRTISGDYTVMCNEQNRTPASLAKDAYCAISSKLPGC